MAIQLSDSGVTFADNTLIGSSNFTNKLINGGFAVNQRVVSGTVVLSAGVYGHDRWKAGAGGCTYTFSTTANVTTITISAGTLVQVIEGLNLFSGLHTLTWTGTAQGRVDGGSYGASGITGTAVGGTNQSIEFGTGTLSRVQYSQGSASSFQQRQIGVEIALCQRYYERSDHSPIWSGNVTSGQVYYHTNSFAVAKRVSSTITASYVGATSFAATAPTLNNQGISGVVFLHTATATASGLFQYNWTASAEL